MWIIANYQATALFSLKPATATASGGRTLLVPTPFAIKMALLDVACRTEGVVVGQAAWERLASLTVALRPPKRVVVNNTFIKILKPRRNPAQPGSQDEGFFNRTITYREYAHLGDDLGIALGEVDGEMVEPLTRWLAGINSLGKRGGFVQLQAIPQTPDNLPEDYLVVDGQMDTFPIDSILTQLDDTGDDVPFDRVDIYSGKKMTMGKHRVLKHVALPYRLVQSSRGYNFYERNDE